MPLPPMHVGGNPLPSQEGSAQRNGPEERELGRLARTAAREAAAHGTHCWEGWSLTASVHGGGLMMGLGQAHTALEAQLGARWWGPLGAWVPRRGKASEGERDSRRSSPGGSRHAGGPQGCQVLL